MEIKMGDDECKWDCRLKPEVNCILISSADLPSGTPQAELTVPNMLWI